MRHIPTILADQLGSIARLPQSSHPSLPGRSQMKSRLTRLAYSLATLAALAAALGAGHRWH